MTHTHQTAARRVQAHIQNLSLFLVLALAIAAAMATLLAALGVLPWLALPAQYGATELPNAGMWLQIAATSLAVVLCAYLPANGRIMALERSHRDFHLSMDDVATAYHVSHEADRDGVFTLASEFDSMRDRMKYLRSHPDLGRLEPELLELAAQMSHQSRDLAEIYSADKVERAQTFLRQREQEIADFQEKLELARVTLADLRRWRDTVEMDEALIQQQLSQLEIDLAELLPGIGFQKAAPKQVDENVFSLGQTGEESRA